MGRDKSTASESPGGKYGGQVVIGGRVGLRRVGPDGLLTFGLSNLVIVLTAGLSWLALWARMHLWVRSLNCPGRAPWIIVLGQQLQESCPGPGYRLRLLRALRLLRRDSEARVLLLGGYTSPEGPSESAAGAAFLRRRGIPASRIFCEEDSRHTLENLKNARDLLAQRLGGRLPSCVLVTSRFHLPRAVAIARGVGLEVCPCPAEHSPRVPQLRLAREIWMLHWYHTGRLFARLIRHQGMLDRIS